MTARADLLIEIGTEELPPRALRGLMTAFADGVGLALAEQRLEFESIVPFASPRRLALTVTALAEGQEDRAVEMKGPPVRIAFDDAGKPTPAAVAFAKKCDVAVEELDRAATDKGEWLVHNTVETGHAAAEILPGLIETVLTRLPIPRPMRWGSSEAEFVRPVHWVVLLHGERPIDGTVLGVAADRTTRGHRFMAPDHIQLADAGEYASVLESQGYVVADFAERRRRIESGVTAAAAECGGEAVATDALYDEVTALVEWPVAITGHFEADYLELPREVIVATLTSHQRYFPVAGNDGALLPAFVTIANLVSNDPNQVREGNERVIRPRLADAAFFWATDKRVPLAERVAALDRIVYQKGLGSMRDKSARVAGLAAQIASAAAADPAEVERAALLAKCDLLTGMVGEFPELQGIMGRYYALADGEPDAVAEAIAEQYQPRFAGDAIPDSGAGRAVAIAEKLDTIAGVFALGKKPSGNRDPFGLRRSGLGIVRIVTEASLELDLPALVEDALAAQPTAAPDDASGDIYEFIVERMRAYCMERDGVTTEMFEAVKDRRPASLADFELRLRAVAAFVGIDAAESLSAANKRIANILRQADHHEGGKVDTGLLSEPAEVALYDAARAASGEVKPLLAERAYTDVLTRLAELREPVDRFFDDVMVMVDDEAVRRNRLVLLADLRELFLDVADISRLSLG